MGGGGDPLVREVGAGQRPAVAGRPAPAEHRLGRGPATGHGLGDALALEGVHQPGGVAHQQHPAGRRRRAHHAQLEPTAEGTARGRAAGRSSRPEPAQMGEEVREGPDAPAPAGRSAGSRCRPHVGRPPGRGRSSRSRGRLASVDRSHTTIVGTSTSWSRYVRTAKPHSTRRRRPARRPGPRWLVAPSAPMTKSARPVTAVGGEAVEPPVAAEATSPASPSIRRRRRPRGRRRAARVERRAGSRPWPCPG